MSRPGTPTGKQELLNYPLKNPPHSNPTSFINLWDPWPTLEYLVHAHQPAKPSVLDAANRYCLLVMFYLTKRLIHIDSLLKNNKIPSEVGKINEWPSFPNQTLWIWYHQTAYEENTTEYQNRDAQRLIPILLERIDPNPKKTSAEWVDLYSKNQKTYALTPAIIPLDDTSKKIVDALHSSIPIMDALRKLPEPQSATGSRPTSATGSRPTSATGSRPTSATGSRPTSRESSNGSRPNSPPPLEYDNLASSLSELLWVLFIRRYISYDDTLNQTPIEPKVLTQDTKDLGHNERIMYVNMKTNEAIKKYENLDKATTQELLLLYCRVYAKFTEERVKKQSASKP